MIGPSIRDLVDVRGPPWETAGAGGESYGRPESSAGVPGRCGGRGRAHVARRMAGWCGRGAAASGPGDRGAEAVVRRAGGDHVAAGIARRQRPPRRHGVRQRRSGDAAAQRGHRVGGRSVRLRQPGRRRGAGRDPPARVREPLGGGTAPRGPGHARTAGGATRLSARRQPAVVVPGAGSGVGVPPRAGPRHGRRQRGVRRRRHPLSGARSSPARSTRSSRCGSPRAGRERSRSRRSSTARSARPRPAPTPRRSRWTASRPTWRA